MLTFSEIRAFANDLKPYWTPSEERCGIITPEGLISERPNIAEVPEINFEMTEADFREGIATWHTHPHGSANLSLEDYYLFKSWPSCLHFIIGADRVSCYSMLDDYLVSIDEAEDHPAWVPPRPLPA